MQRFLRRLALVVTAVSATAMFFPSSASAAVEDCRDAVCGWSDADFGGKMTTYPVGVCTNSPFPIHSAANGYPGGMGIPIVLDVYSGPDCTGTIVAVLGRSQSQSLLSQPGLSVRVPW